MGLWAQLLLDSGNLSPEAAKSRDSLLGHWQISTIGTKWKQITKETSHCAGSLGQTEQLCQGTSWPGAFGPLPVEHQKGTRPQKAERKEPRSWHSFTFYPSIHPLASNTCWCNFPPLIRRSAAGADVTALPQGNSGRVSIPTFSPGQEMPLLPDHLLHPRTAYFSSRRPFYYKGPLIQGVLREKATLPGYTRASLPTLTNTCLTSGFSPHPSVT